LGLSEEDLRLFGEADLPSPFVFEPLVAPVASEPAAEMLFEEPTSEQSLDRYFSSPVAADVERFAAPTAPLVSWFDEAPAQAPTVPTQTQPTRATDLDGLRASIGRLGIDRGLFDRGREEKIRLVQAGRIQGSNYLPGAEPAGPSLQQLEEQVRSHPDDGEARLHLASALIDANEAGRALDEYRHIFRSRNGSTEELTAGLLRIAAKGANVAPAAHRVLGAVYRRSGNYALSASHYQSSLEAYLRAPQGAN
jgi:hypothetical protein